MKPDENSDRPRLLVRAHSVTKHTPKWGAWCKLEQNSAETVWLVLYPRMAHEFASDARRNVDLEAAQGIE